jgi:hypothetical protein
MLNTYDWINGCYFQLEIQVLAAADSSSGPRRIIATKLESDVTTNQDRAAVSYEFEAQMPREYIAAFPLGYYPVYHPITHVNVARQGITGSRQRAIDPLLHRLCLQLDLVWVPQIIRV